MYQPRPLRRRLSWRAWAGALMLCCLAGVGQAAAPAPPRLDFHEAGFKPPGDAPEVTVALPDTWVRRGLSRKGTASYRFRFKLDSVPDTPLALQLARVSSTHQLFVNGQLVASESSAGRDHPVPALMDLPTPLLRRGMNEVEIVVHYRTRGGLSTATLGPAGELRLRQYHDALWSRELPRSLNMGMAVLALFMLTVWWRRRSERTIGLFGLLALLGSLRNYTYFAEVALLPAGVSDWLFYSAQVATAVLFGAFALSLDGANPRPRLVRLILVFGLGLCVAAAVLIPMRQLPGLRAITYPLLILAGVVAVTEVWRAVRRLGDVTHYTLLLSFVAVIFAMVHDYGYQEGYLPMTGQLWLPFVMPFALAIYAFMLMGRLVTAMTDVERLNVELEHRVEQRTRALQTANAAKTRFLASASHDLRQPVAAIGLMISLLRDQITAPRMRQLIDRVDEAVASMENMLKGLLDLSRLESGTAKARPQRVALQPMFDAIALHEREGADLRGLRLRFRPTSLAVTSDPVLLDQILRNLVSNAVRYTGQGGVLVSARARGQGEAVLLQVWDTGIGIAADDQSAIFEEFVQVGNAARERTLGLGLGLSIVKRSVEVLGHPLSVRSSPGRGSCFSLRLPRGVDERRAAPRLPPAPQPFAGLRVLWVEDDAAVRDSLGARLQAWGAQVQSFDGVPALRAALPGPGVLRNGSFTDLLITDQRLPGGSGLLVIELVRQRCGPTRALVVTGDTSPDDLGLLAASGVAVLHKPFRVEQLLEVMRRVLEVPAET